MGKRIKLITKRIIINRDIRLKWGNAGRLRYLLQKLGWRIQDKETYTMISKKRWRKLYNWLNQEDNCE